MAITEFKGQYGYLSNFYDAVVSLDQLPYKSVEHAYQAAKTTDEQLRRPFRTPDMTAAQAKRAGRALPIRPDWNSVKLDIMYDLVHQKFFNHTDLMLKLMGTGDQEIVEGNYWHDYFWGVCEGEGENHLGLIIMRVRSELNARLNPAPATDVKLCIFGSRDFNDYVLLCSRLEATKIYKSQSIKYIVCGEARGADRLGRRFAVDHGIEVISMPADWDQYGKKAGYLRNEQMAKISTHAIGFWDGQSKGTKHMIDLCARWNVNTWVIRY